MFRKITLATAIQRAVNLRHAKAGFQVAIEYIADQVYTHGNADAITQVFRAAEMLANEHGTLVVTKPGSAAWQYLSHETSKGGLGLGAVVRWDGASGSFKMIESWKDAVDDIDLARVVINLQTLWYLHQTVPAVNAFDLDKAIKSLVSKAAKAGVSREDLAKAMTRAVPEIAARQAASLIAREPACAVA